MIDRPISISEILLFNRCRFAWATRYVRGLKPKKPAWHLQLGSDVHKVVEDFHNGILTSEHAVSRQAIVIGLRLIREYEQWIGAPVQPVTAEKWTEVAIWDDPDRPFMVMIVDLVRRSEDDRLILVDFKTTRNLSMTRMFMNPQVLTYLTLARRVDELADVKDFEMVQVRIDPYVDRERPTVLVDEFTAEPELLDGHLEWLRKMVTKIWSTKQAFVDDPSRDPRLEVKSLDWSCSRCDYEPICESTYRTENPEMVEMVAYKERNLSR